MLSPQAALGQHPTTPKHVCPQARLCLLFLLSQLRRDAAVLHRRGEDDLRARAAKLVELVDELVELLRRMEEDLEQHRIIARHAVAFHDIGAFLHVGIKLRLLLRLHLQGDERLDPVAHRRSGDLRLIAGDEPGGLQPLDACADRRGGEEHLLGDHLERRARVVLQNRQNLAIDIVHANSPFFRS